MADYTGRDQRFTYLFQHGGGGGGASALTDLSDVNVTSPADGEGLLYDAQNQKWVNGVISGGGSGVAVVEEVLSNTETTLTAWANPLSIPLSLNSYVGFGVEITWQSGSSPITCYVTAGQISGNSYVLIPWYQGNKTHNDLYIGYSNGNLNFYVETTYRVTIHRVTGLRKVDAHSHIYSTTEQVVGTWIDGKPVYEITFTQVTQNIASGSMVELADLSSLAIENVVSITGGVWYETGTAADKRYLSLGDYCGIEYGNSTGKAYGRQNFTSATANRTWTFIATVRFTKSTD